MKNKKIIYLSIIFAVMLFFPRNVSALVSVYSSRYVNFFSEYDFDDPSSNTLTKNLDLGTLTYSWVKASDASAVSTLNYLYDFCAPQVDEDDVITGVLDQDGCNEAISTAQSRNLLPDDFITYNGNASMEGITDGTWILWGSFAGNGVQYYSYKVYDIKLPEKPEPEPEPEPQSDSDSASDVTPSNSSTTPTKTYQNVNTGVSNLAFVIVPIILAVGVYVTLRKDKYTED